MSLSAAKYFPPCQNPVDFDVEDQSPSNIELTPRAHPPLRHDIFSPARPVDFDVEDQSPSSVELTPRAHSTLRRRKGRMFMLLNDSIIGEPASEVLVAADPKDAEPNEASHEVALADDELTDCDYDCEDKYSEFVVPALPQPSRLLPLQLFLLPTWCAIVGAAILLFPAGLNAIAFPRLRPHLRLRLRFRLQGQPPPTPVPSTAPYCALPPPLPRRPHRPVPSRTGQPSPTYTSRSFSLSSSVIPPLQLLYSIFFFAVFSNPASHPEVNTLCVSARDVA
ncbi:hypothetical protein MVEN_00020700 [Mycena venus]|uniref:Uncharacterized protein n=1 Tax=Mycena venus TaxID=2733690 RepID=A0A8H7DDN8_9AGAR|nr:hypothetical protein MVEN_00020700 [Mycena venus]